jgi:hypothetical protein
MSATTCRMLAIRFKTYVATCGMFMTRFQMSTIGYYKYKTLVKIFPSESKASTTSWIRLAVRAFLTPHHSDRSNNITGNQLIDSLLRWLSPRDPSTNHNIASKAHYNGTAEWFFRGTIFSKWKSTGSFLWIHGKRAFHLTLTLLQPLIVLCFHSGVREKCPLVRLPSDFFHPCEINIIISVPRSYMIS